MRRVIVTLLICVFALGMNAQDMTSVFTAMPDQYIPLLEHAWRKDLVDLYTSGKESRLKNTMNGFSTLQKLTNDYLLLQTTERSTVEMKLLPLVNNTYVVCMISTVNGPVPDSRIEFFTTNWEPLATSDLFTQPTSDWYIKQGIDKKAEAYQYEAEKSFSVILSLSIHSDIVQEVFLRYYCTAVAAILHVGCSSTAIKSLFLMGRRD